MRLPWLVSQREDHLLFTSWPADRDELRALVPASMQIREYDGTPWITMIPFQMVGLRLRFLPPIPGTSSYPEVDLCTYVSIDGNDGLFFLSIDTPAALAALFARLFFKLPYRKATARLEATGDGAYTFTSNRPARGDVPAAAFDVRYEPYGEIGEAAPGSREDFLLEALQFFSQSRFGTIFRGVEERPRRRIQQVKARIDTNSVPAAAGITLPDREPLFHYVPSSQIKTWVPMPWRRA